MGEMPRVCAGREITLCGIWETFKLTLQIQRRDGTSVCLWLPDIFICLNLNPVLDFLLKHRQAKQNRDTLSSAHFMPVLRSRHSIKSTWMSEKGKVSFRKKTNCRTIKRKKEPNETVMVNRATPPKWALLGKVMTYKSIYETITVAVCFAIDPKHTIERRYELVWKSISVLDDYELLHGAAFSWIMTLRIMQSISIHFSARVSQRSHICNVLIMIYQHVFGRQLKPDPFQGSLLLRLLD